MKFQPNNPYARLGGKAVAAKYGREYMRKLGKRGLIALAEHHFNNDITEALAWLGKCGAWASDQGYREIGLGIMPEPERLSCGRNNS